MNRYLKALGLALVAALALSALAAASASAQNVQDKFVTTAGQTAFFTVEGEEIQTFKGSTNDTRDFRCKKLKGKGTIKDGATEVTFVPEYSECDAFDTVKNEVISSATPVFNGCDYLFKGLTTDGNPTANGKHANVQIICPVGKEIELTVTALKLKCVTIPGQEINHAVRYKNETTEPSKITDVTVEATPHGIKVKTPNTAACPTPSGKPEEHSNGLYTGKARVTGFKDAAHTIPTSVSVSPG